MPSYSRTRRVQAPADVLYETFADVARYPEFITGVAATTVLSETSVSENITVRDVRLTLSGLGLRQELVARARCDRGQRALILAPVSGPLDKLHAFILIEPDDENCALTAEIDCRFRSPVTGALINPMFDLLMRKLLAAFVKRALAQAALA